MSVLFALLISLILPRMGLGQMPGSVKVTTSKLDGEQQVQVEPGWLKGEKMSDRPPKLGGFWSGKSATNFTLEAVLFGESKPERVRIGIDGAISEFPTTNGARVITSFTQGVKGIETVSRFIVPLSFVQQMVAGTNVVIQEDARGFTEGVFSADAPTRARPGFKKALEKIKNPDTVKNASSAAAKFPRVK